MVKIAGLSLWKWIVWAFAVFGIPLGMIRALDAYPLLENGNVSIWIFAFGIALVTLAAAAGFRRRLFPWGREHPVVQWGTILGFAAIGGMAALGSLVFANGYFDSSVPELRHYEVQQLAGYRDRRTLTIVDEAGATARFSIARSLARGVRRGHSLHLFVRRGLIAPWIERVEFPDVVDDGSDE